MKFNVPLALTLTTVTSAFPFLPLTARVTNLDSTTQSDLLNGTPCKPLTIIFARGTSSPGNVGESTGPPFFKAVAAIFGINNIAVQGVDYSANIFGFLGGGDSQGSATMKSLIDRAYQQCPNTKLVLSGYRYVPPRVGRKLKRDAYMFEEING